MRVPNVFAEHSDGLGVRIALELVSTLLEDKPQFARVGDDAVVDDGELVVNVGSLRMAVHSVGHTMRSPPGVRDGALGKEGLGLVLL